MHSIVANPQTISSENAMKTSINTGQFAPKVTPPQAPTRASLASGSAPKYDASQMHLIPGDAAP
jgi:hypothetical protein